MDGNAERGGTRGGEWLEFRRAPCIVALAAGMRLGFCTSAGNHMDEVAGGAQCSLEDAMGGNKQGRQAARGRDAKTSRLVVIN